MGGVKKVLCSAVETFRSLSFSANIYFERRPVYDATIFLQITFLLIAHCFYSVSNRLGISPLSGIAE